MTAKLSRMGEFCVLLVFFLVCLIPPIPHSEGLLTFLVCSFLAFRMALLSFSWNILIVGRTTLNYVLHSKQEHELNTVSLSLKLISGRLKSDFWGSCTNDVCSSFFLFSGFVCDFCTAVCTSCNTSDYNCRHFLGQLSVSVRPPLLLRKGMPEKDVYAKDKYIQLSRRAVCPRL